MGNIVAAVPPTHSLIPSRRVVALALTGALALLLAFAPLAFADAFTPESGGSPNADDIDTLYKIAFYLGVVIFLGVEGTLIYALVRFRHKRSNREPAQIRGNARLEIGWTIGAVLILVVLTVITFVALPAIRSPEASEQGGLARQGVGGLMFAATDQPRVPAGGALNIRVNGQQFLWRYDYPERGLYSYYEMVVPVNTTVTLDITASDVIHSWWIPKLGGKLDATPGYVNKTWFKISKPGVYEGQCAELCGENHAQMLARVRAVPVEEYEAWKQGQAAGIAESQRLLALTRAQREGQQ